VTMKENHTRRDGPLLSLVYTSGQEGKGEEGDHLTLTIAELRKKVHCTPLIFPSLSQQQT
jgi:hypothetical protein